MKITVQVVYAEPKAVWQKLLCLPAGASAIQALRASGFFTDYPALDNTRLAMGIYGQACTGEQVLVNGDRLEIYRALQFDPLESRRRRAIHRKAFMIKPANRPKRRKARLAAAYEDAQSGAKG